MLSQLQCQLSRRHQCRLISRPWMSRLINPPFAMIAIVFSTWLNIRQTFCSIWNRMRWVLLHATCQTNCANALLDTEDSASSSGVHAETAWHQRLDAIDSRRLAGGSERRISSSNRNSLARRQLHRSLSELYVGGSRKIAIGWNRCHVHCIVRK